MDTHTDGHTDWQRSNFYASEKIQLSQVGDVLVSQIIQVNKYSCTSKESSKLAATYLPSQGPIYLYSLDQQTQRYVTHWFPYWFNVPNRVPVLKTAEALRSIQLHEAGQTSWQTDWSPEHLINQSGSLRYHIPSNFVSRTLLTHNRQLPSN